MRRCATLLGTVLLVLLCWTAPARAAVGPLYDVKATWGPTYLTPGDTKADTAEAQFSIQVRNVGDAVGNEDLIITDELPIGVRATAINWPNPNLSAEKLCTGTGTERVECKVPAALLASELAPPGITAGNFNKFSPLHSGYLARIYIDASVPKKVPDTGVNVDIVSGGGASTPASDVDQLRFRKDPSPFDVVEGSFLADTFTDAYPFGEPARQASDRPFDLRVNFDITARTGINDGPGEDGTRYITSNGQLRTFEATLPKGMIGNPEATPKCDPALFAEAGAMANSTACPSDTQVGYLNIAVNDGNSNYGHSQLVGEWGALSRVPIYNLKPPKGVPADLAFNAGGVTQAHIYTIPDPAQDYALKSVAPNVSSIIQVRGSEAVIWGVPGDPAHDRFRWYPEKQNNGDVMGAPWGSAPIRPLLTNPMDCGVNNGGARVRVDSYNNPGQFSPVQEYGDPLNVKGCDDPRFRFEPEISLRPTDRHAGAPTGLDVDLEVPQRNDEVEEASKLYAANGDVKAIATPPIKKAVVTLPEGMTLSPSAAQGLEGCSSAQIGLGTDSKVTCPDASQYGTLTLHTPLFPIDAQPKGFIYLARQGDNPFHNFLSLYLVVEEPDRGILVKVPGRIDLDPNTGQITTTFDDLPQFPVSDMQMSLKGGVRAGLVNPGTCGAKTITARFFSWQDPGVPHTVKSSYMVAERPDGTPCVADLADRPFGPQISAGTRSNTAGSYSPFLLRLTRSDEDQEFSQLGLNLPPGLTAKFAGVARCPETGIAQATGARSGAGDGALEQGSPSCPAASEIGSTDVGVGVGVPLTYVPGKVYLAGPYKGAPLSVVAITPAVVGPYDLGVIAVRSALRVNRETAQGSVLSDAFPLIFQGIPVRLRDIRLKLDLSEFTLNPTSCAAKRIGAHITGAGGDMSSSNDDVGVDLFDRFQAVDCAGLSFKPRLSFRLFGSTGRGGHPKLRAVYRPRPGDANAASVSVALPHSEFLDQGHIKTVCTRVQFAADACPAGSVYGKVTAKSPLFDEAFTGSVYLRSSSHPLPDLVAALKGPPSLPAEVDVVGHIDSIHGGIRSTFDMVPDVPVSSFVLTMQGSKKGLLVNSVNLCATTHHATVQLRAQNNKRATLRPLIRASCGKAKRAQHGEHR
jgi:hypothetical protein